jgi:hypothetical protein
LIILDEFIIEKQHNFTQSSEQLIRLLGVIRFATQIVNGDMNKVQLADIIGDTKGINDVIKYCAGKISTNKARVTSDSYYYFKTYSTGKVNFNKQLDHLFSPFGITILDFHRV